MINRIKHELGKVYRRLGQITYKDENIYLIYTMGKVGSSSIYRSLKEDRPFADNFHIHHLSDYWLHEVLPKGHKKYFPNIAIGDETVKFIKKRPHKRLKVITLTREPVVRSISDIFENWRATYDNIDEVDQETLKNHVESVDYDYPLNWFDSEFKRYLNIDIYSRPFDIGKGYTIYEFDSADVLCIKLEMLNEVGEQAIEEFLGFHLELFQANKSTDKKTKDKYLYLKENLKIDSAKLEELYSSKFMKHFYSDSEIESFKKRWTR